MSDARRNYMLRLCEVLGAAAIHMKCDTMLLVTRSTQGAGWLEGGVESDPTFVASASCTSTRLHLGPSILS